MTAVMDFWSKASEVMLKDISSNNQAQATMDQLTLHNIDQGKQMYLANIARYGYGIDPTPYLSPYGVPPTNVNITNSSTNPQAGQGTGSPITSSGPLPTATPITQSQSSPSGPSNNSTSWWKKLLTSGLIGIGSGALIGGGGYLGYQTLMNQIAGQQFQLKINAAPDQPQINVQPNNPIPIPTVPGK